MNLYYIVDQSGNINTAGSDEYFFYWPTRVNIFPSSIYIAGVREESSTPTRRKWVD